MSAIRKKASLRNWKNANIALQQALRAGDLVDAKRQADTLLHYLEEMGLINDNDRLVHRSNCGNSNTNPGD